MFALTESLALMTTTGMNTDASPRMPPRDDVLLYDSLVMPGGWRMPER
jgi:hypothetical protein